MLDQMPAARIPKVGNKKTVIRLASPDAVKVVKRQVQR